MTATASLPMYAFPAMRAANTALWRALAERLRADGYENLPEELSIDQPPVPDELAPHTVFTQTCGYPLQTIYRGQFQLLATPSYDSPGCGAMTHSAFVIVRDDDDVADVSALRGKRFAMNSVHSNSGMNLPRRLIAPLARNGRFFSQVITTHSHARSLALIRDGAADSASVDCLTWTFANDYAPELTAGLRILAQTPDSPAIPFVTALATPSDMVEAIRRALHAIGSEPQYHSVRTALRLRSIGDLPPDAYDILLRYEREAIALGYPEIA